MNANPYDLLLTDEQRLLLKTRKLRESMVDNIIEEEGKVPTDLRKVRLLNEVMNSLDDQVLTLVDRRIKHSSDESTKDLTETIRSVFLEVDKKRSTANVLEQPELTDKELPDDVVDGETKIGHEAIELNDILGDTDDI